MVGKSGSSLYHVMLMGIAGIARIGHQKVSIGNLCAIITH